MSDVIEFRFAPDAPWESVPAGYTRVQAVRMFKDYDLRINGGDVIGPGNDHPWETYDDPDGVHVMPMQGTDPVAHDLDGDCACGPHVDFGGSRPLYIHHSLDGRELTEETR